MQAGVPQFIDIEDKIAFGLTAKQLLWMGAMVAVLIVAYSLFNRQLFFAIAFFVIVIFASLAFWRPQGVSLFSFLGFTLLYLFKPKNYIWRRVYSAQSKTSAQKATLAQQKNAPAHTIEKHLPNRGQLKKIAWELDTRK
jgi:hypothetical protein